MKDNVLMVKMWGREVCSILWDGGYEKGFGRRGAVFNFVKTFPEFGYDIAPLAYPLSDPMVQRGLPITCREKEYGGLPSFLSDSLPDDWGDEVFNRWTQANGLSRNRISPVDRLSFIGKRGMGAFEFEPETYSSPSQDHLQLESLWSLALEIERGRSLVSLNLNDHPSLEDLMRVGTSAGGKHPKAIIAIHEKTGEVRSGQLPLPPEYSHYILKFNEGGGLPLAEIEYAYYLMACDCGIEMMPSRLFPIAGVNHFLTKRFDRKDGTKCHVSTLYAMAGEVTDYFQLFSVSRELHIPGKELQQLFRRMVFNFRAGNSDDHHKNFSFVMEQDGKWHLAPAYDLTFSYDYRNPFIGGKHAMTLGGKREGVSARDLEAFALKNDIPNPREVIRQVDDTVSRFETFAREADVGQDAVVVLSDVLDHLKWAEK